MIYLDGLSSIIECTYLGEQLSSKVSACNIFVNPENIRYLVGKTIIINNIGYDQDKYIPTLLKNNCFIISRISVKDIYVDRVDFQPYILNICKDVVWNGKIISQSNEIEELSELLEENLCDFDLATNHLYFPKMNLKNRGIYGLRTKDNEGNLTELGWVLHQVGVNLVTDTELKNLDIIKSRKVLFE